MNPVEFVVTRDTFATSTAQREGYALGTLECDGELVCQTVEDEDRHIEEGNSKVYGKTAMPLGRYKLTLYASPTKGVVPLFHDVPNFSMTEIHRANQASELLGCVGIGMKRRVDGVFNCQPALDAVLKIMVAAKEAKQEVYCTITRIEP